MLDVLGLTGITLNTSKTANCVHKRWTIKQRYKHVNYELSFHFRLDDDTRGEKGNGEGSLEGRKESLRRRHLI